jgi:hypothetical protein
MRRLQQIITAGFLLSGSISAQQPVHDPFYDAKQKELMFLELDSRRTEIDREVALRRQALYLESQFLARMNRFVALWSAFANEYNEKHAFNIKLADEISKAFHELENDEGWPKFKRHAPQ